MDAFKIAIKHRQIVERNDIRIAHTEGREDPGEDCPAPDAAELFKSICRNVDRRLVVFLR